MVEFLTNQPQAVFLVAGQGARMYPLTGTRPKVMLPVAGKPMVEHLLIECREAGLSNFVFVVGYLRDKIMQYFGDGSAWGIRISYAIQKQPIGTADALCQALPLLDEQSFMMFNGDVWLHRNEIKQLCHCNQSTLSIVELDDVSEKGVVEIDGERIIRLHEKSPNPPTHFANAGIYYFTPEVFSALAKTPRSKRGEFEITDTIQLMIDSGNQLNYHPITTWHELGYPWDLIGANETSLNCIEPRNDGRIEEGSVVKGKVIIGKESIIRSGSYVIGPVIIGDGCDIGPNCYIRPATTIGNCCHIGAGVEVKNSIIMAGTKIPHLSYVGDSVIGEKCNLGAGTQVANLRLDKKNVRINGRDTGRKKMGTVMGDEVSTGINANINPGCLIGDGTFIGPGALARGIIPPGSKVF